MLALRGFFEDHDAGAEIMRRDRRRDAGGAKTDDDIGFNVPVLRFFHHPFLMQGAMTPLPPG
jgi:hypothetical protein